jgi:cob(I)alamin adenosyltransferase
MTIYTRYGDSGETSLCGGERVAKDHLRIQVCGTIDELSATLGIVRAEGLTPQQNEIIVRIQKELIEFCTEIAGLNGIQRIHSDSIKKMETEIDEREAKLPPLTEFVLAGADKTSAFLHLARTVCRRAERHLVTLIRNEPHISPTLLTYLNRLSDLLFVLTR